MPKQLQRTRTPGTTRHARSARGPRGEIESRNAAARKLSLAQWVLLVELDNDGGSVRCHGRGPLSAGSSLVRLGLAERAHVNDKHGEVFALTEAGKLRAKEGP